MRRALLATLLGAASCVSGPGATARRRILAGRAALLDELERVLG